MKTEKIEVVDSHTGGEPTRLVMEGGPELGAGPLTERLQRFCDHHDRFRSAIVNEPRGSDAMVGALLCEPEDSTCAAGVIFFNNVGYLGMCGHGTIGLIATLAHLGKIDAGKHRIETPVGIVTAELNTDGSVTIENVPSHRKTRNARIRLDGGKEIIGDVAWGGNWFFLTHSNELDLTRGNLEPLIDHSWKIRAAVNGQGFPEVDHVELFTHSGAERSGRNFVLCPGKAYDRSPCGTGTSAKLACLAADGELAEGEMWVQESIIGSHFKGSYRWLDRGKGVIAPRITGTAFVTAEATLVLQNDDPYCWGIS